MSTSGSTGSPKCVRLSRSNLSSNAVAIAEYLGLGPDDRAITSLPLHYCYGLSVLHSHLTVGAGVVMSEHSVVDRCFWSAVSEHGVTSIAAVPHSLELMDRSGTSSCLGTPSLRRLTVAGGRTAPAVVQRYATLGERWGWDLVVMYGQTEATARMAYLPPQLARRHPGAIGVAIPGGSLELVQHDGGDPDVGELVYRGPNVMMGYATTPSDLRRGSELDALRTGDLARRSEDGLFEIVGRSSRFAKLFGLRIDLDHLEDLLSDHGVRAWCVATDDALALLTTDGCPARVEELVAAETGLPRSAVHVSRSPRNCPVSPTASPIDATSMQRSGHPVSAEDPGAVSRRSGRCWVSRWACWTSAARRPSSRSAGTPCRTSRSPCGSRSCSAISRRTGTPHRWSSSSAGWRPRCQRRAPTALATPGDEPGAAGQRDRAGGGLARRSVPAARRRARAPGGRRVQLRPLRVAARCPDLAVHDGEDHRPCRCSRRGVARRPQRRDRRVRLGQRRSGQQLPRSAAVERRMALLVHRGARHGAGRRDPDHVGPRGAAMGPPSSHGGALAAPGGGARRTGSTWSPLGSTPEPLLAPHRVAWFFVLGWFVARAERTSARLVATG